MNDRVVKDAEKFLCKQDRVLKYIIDQFGPCPLGKGRANYFDTLARSIISQQLSVKAASTIGNRVLALTGQPSMDAQQLCKLSQPQLRAAGLSNNKANFLLDLSEEYISGRLNFRALAQQTDAQVIERLIQLRGIGVWTAEMFLMFALRRPNIASPADVGLQRAMVELYGLRKKPSTRTFLRIA